MSYCFYFFGNTSLRVLRCLFTRSSTLAQYAMSTVNAHKEQDDDFLSKAVYNDIILAREVRKHRELYIRNNPYYKLSKEEKINKDTAWRAVAANIGISPLEARAKWRVVRDRYVRLRKKYLRGSVQYEETPLLKEMSFLGDFITHKSSQNYRSLQNRPDLQNQLTSQNNPKKRGRPPNSLKKRKVLDAMGNIKQVPSFNSIVDASLLPYQIRNTFSTEIVDVESDIIDIDTVDVESDFNPHVIDDSSLSFEITKRCVPEVVNIDSFENNSALSQSTKTVGIEQNLSAGVKDDDSVLSNQKGTLIPTSAVDTRPVTSDPDINGRSSVLQAERKSVTESVVQPASTTVSDSLPVQTINCSTDIPDVESNVTSACTVIDNGLLSEKENNNSSSAASSLPNLVDLKTNTSLTDQTSDNFQISSSQQKSDSVLPNQSKVSTVDTLNIKPHAPPDGTGNRSSSPYPVEESIETACLVLGDESDMRIESNYHIDSDYESDVASKKLTRLLEKNIQSIESERARGNASNDEDELFCRSVATALKKFLPKKKAFAKLKIQQALYDVECQFPTTAD